MAKEVFPRMPSGLVDFSCYLDYLHDPPEEVPPTLSRRKYDSELWRDHHGYFRYDSWSKEGKNDQDIIDFRSYPYNRFVMRPWEESKIHHEFEDDVKPPSIETIRQTLEEFHRLDTVVAAEVGIQTVNNPEILNEIGNIRPPRAWAVLEPGARIELLKARQVQALAELDETRFIQDLVVNSVIQRTARQIGSEALAGIAASRLKDEDEILPVRVKKLSDLYYISNQLLTEICAIEGIKIPVAA